MADIVNNIPVVVDGESAYDFRLKVNEAITGVNTAFEKINQEYDYIVEASEQYQSLKEHVESIQDWVDTYEETAKQEITQYFESFTRNKVEDLSTVQVRRNKPVGGSTGYLPDFWYKVVNSGPLVLYAKLKSPSTSTFSSMELDKNNNWSVSNNIWTIYGNVVYNKNNKPNSGDELKLMLTLEDGSYIVSDEYGVITGANYNKIQPKYDVYDKSIYWTFSNITEWNQITDQKLLVGNISVTDGIITQKFNIEIALR